MRPDEFCSRCGARPAIGWLYRAPSPATRSGRYREAYQARLILAGLAEPVCRMCAVEAKRHRRGN
jgi:hypothetical protein